MSGIYISGMEMPKRDEVITIYPDGTAHRHHLGLRLNISEGKAVPVFDHGRLIDGDELAAGCDDPHWCRWLGEIEDMPTIIPADKEEYKCESCVYNPPSSCDGKPCTQCDTRNPLTNCYIPAEVSE